MSKVRAKIGGCINWLLKPYNIKISKRKPNDYSKPITRSDSQRGGLSVFEKQAYLEESEFQYILWIDRVYEKIRSVPGHVVELGVAYGRNSIIFSRMIQLHGETATRKYFGFDTFDGYTEETLETNPHLSGKTWKDCDRNRIEARLKRANVERQTTLIEGDILETVPQFLKENPNFRCALLYVDCNAFEPSLEGMKLFQQFMSPGGVICIDEKRQGGETKALIEFCNLSGLEYKRDPGALAVPAYTIVK
ncbi:MAG: class I SAM-dependent methyltransferase [Verrucomicrobiales bacterium]|nr:class I SAM-dependent methyltransferase [Verrucomicrobiales bacterium]